MFERLRLCEMRLHGYADPKPLRLNLKQSESEKALQPEGSVKNNEACGAGKLLSNAGAAKSDRANRGRRSFARVSLQPGVRYGRPGSSTFTAA
jgi:hypothetical protein